MTVAQELVMTTEVNQRLLDAPGEYTIRAPTTKTSKGHYSAKKINGLTINQRKCIEYLKAEQQALGNEITKYLSICSNSISAVIQPLIKKGIVSKCDETKTYYMTDNKPDKFKFIPAWMPVRDGAKELGTFQAKELSHLSDNISSHLSVIKKRGLIKQISHKKWQYIG